MRIAQPGRDCIGGLGRRVGAIKENGGHKHKVDPECHLGCHGDHHQKTFRVRRQPTMELTDKSLQGTSSDPCHGRGMYISQSLVRIPKNDERQNRHDRDVGVMIIIDVFGGPAHRKGQVCDKGYEGCEDCIATDGGEMCVISEGMVHKKTTCVGRQHPEKDDPHIER